MKGTTGNEDPSKRKILLLIQLPIMMSEVTTLYYLFQYVAAFLFYLAHKADIPN
ncbi:hypothetical protein [Bacteroides sp.]|uniref:hypothetical protein n=1 Tax=Bacteroides sp. TaxID=29523 RepID=UPI0025C43BDF|nr:hypothetical protein [Bacteroides sp.]